MLIISLDLSRAVAEFSDQVTFKVAQSEPKEEILSYEVALTSQEKEWLKKFESYWTNITSNAKLGAFNADSQRTIFLVKLSEREKYIIYYYSKVISNDWKIKLASMMDEL